MVQLSEQVGEIFMPKVIENLWQAGMRINVPAILCLAFIGDEVQRRAIYALDDGLPILLGVQFGLG